MDRFLIEINKCINALTFHLKLKPLSYNWQSEYVGNKHSAARCVYGSVIGYDYIASVNSNYDYYYPVFVIDYNLSDYTMPGIVVVCIVVVSHGSSYKWLCFINFVGSKCCPDDPAAEHVACSKEKGCDCKKCPSKCF